MYTRVYILYIYTRTTSKRLELYTNISDKLACVTYTDIDILRVYTQDDNRIHH